MVFQLPGILGLRRIGYRRASVLAHHVLVVLAISLLLSPCADAEHLAPEDYPDMGNVQRGCDGVIWCFQVLVGGGRVTTEAIQNDLRILTAGLPPGVGLIAHRPSTYTDLGMLGFPGSPRFYEYSQSDIETFAADNAVNTRIFGPQTVTITTSDGVRAARDGLGSNLNQRGYLFEIDKVSRLPMRGLNASGFETVVNFSADYDRIVTFALQTGPSDLGHFQSYYPIIVGSSINVGVLDFLDTHESTIHLGLVATNAALNLLVESDISGMRILLLSQRIGQLVPAPTSSGVPEVTSPPQGGVGAPSDGGGIGIESFPAWLRKGMPHEKPDWR